MLDMMCLQVDASMRRDQGSGAQSHLPLLHNIVGVCSREAGALQEVHHLCLPAHHAARFSLAAVLICKSISDLPDAQKKTAVSLHPVRKGAHRAKASTRRMLLT